MEIAVAEELLCEFLYFSSTGVIARREIRHAQPGKLYVQILTPIEPEVY